MKKPQIKLIKQIIGGKIIITTPTYNQALKLYKTLKEFI